MAANTNRSIAAPSLQPNCSTVQINQEDLGKSPKVKVPIELLLRQLRDHSCNRVLKQMTYLQRNTFFTSFSHGVHSPTE